MTGYKDNDRQRNHIHLRQRKARLHPSPLLAQKRAGSRSKRVAFSALFISLASGTALGQSDTTSVQVQDVVVDTPAAADTAQATSQQQIQEKQSAPVASTIVTQEQLEAAQITDLQEAQKLEPSLNIKFQNVRNIAINVRGFGASSSGATDAIFGGSPVYVNGVYQPFVGQAVFQIPDLVGVEVLKGPQATAGGQDNTGGLVNITTALPSFTMAQKYLFQYGSYNQFQESGSVTGPVAGTDSAAFRLSYFNNDQQGYLRSTTSNQLYFGSHDKAAEAMLLLTPTKDLTALFTLSYSTTTQSCCASGFAGVQTAYTNGTPVPNNFYARAARIGISVPNAATLLSSYTTSGNGWQNTEQDTYGFSSKIDYIFNGFTIDSVTAFFDWDFHPHNDFTTTTDALVQYGTGTGSQVTAKSVEQQISVATPKGGPVEATGGIFYFWDLLIDRGKTAYGPLQGTFAGSTSNTALVNNTALNWLMYSAYDNPTTNEIAPYIQTIWHATPEFDISSGIRYSYNIKSSDFAQWISSAEPLTGLTAAQQASVIAQRNTSAGPNRSWYATTHQGILSAVETASYKITPDIIAYVTGSLGGRAGGPNPASGNLPISVPETVKAEHIVNFETGLKASWFDQRLITNITAFTMVDFNYIAYQSSLLGASTATYLANAKRADSRGVELDVRAKPTDDITTFATLTYDDTFYGSFDNAACPPEVTGQTSCSLTGKPISLTPKWVFTLGGEYTQHLGSLFQPVTTKPVIGYFGSDFTWQSRFFSNYDDSAYSIINPYGVLDFHAGIRFEDSSWDFSGWIHNALNKHYYTQIAVAGGTGGEITATVGPPLEAGLTLRVKF